MQGLGRKRYVVAGSATGIGAATARRLAAEGAHVHLGDFAADKAELVARDIRASGGVASSEFFDLHDEGSIQALVGGAVEALGGLDGVVNVAYEGRPEYHGRDVAIGEFDPEVWSTVLHANVIGTALVIKNALPHLIEAGGGAIVNVSSGAAQAGEEIRVAYGVSKAGINSFTRHIAKTYGEKGIRANAVSPGAVLTEAGEAAFPEEVRELMIAHSPIKRLGQPDDIAGTIAFLLSEDGEWISGQVWHHNGGTMFRE